MSKINLISDVNLEKLKIKRRNFLMMFTAGVVLAALVIVALLLQGYKWVRQGSLEKTEEKIASTMTELDGYRDIETTILNIETGLKAIEDIESKEHKWSLFLPHLEKAIPSDVQFTSLSQNGNTFQASAVGRNISSVGRTIYALEEYKYKDPKTNEEKSLFGNTSISGYTKDKKKGTVSFEVSFDMKEGALW